MRILIVDDSKAMQVIVQRSVSKLDVADLELGFAFNGMEGLEKVRTWEPDLVIADWHMPELGGYELLLAINREMLPIRIGFVTTETSEAKLQAAFDAGAEFVVNKPFEAKDLVAVLQPIINSIEQQKLSDDDAVSPAKRMSSEENKTGHRIVMPKDTTLQKTLNALCKQTIRVESVEIQDLNESWLPALVGVFVDAKEGVVHGICVSDMIATASLSGVLAGLPSAAIKKAINYRDMQKDVVAHMERIFEVISVTIYDSQNNCELNFKSMSMINTDMKKLEALLSRRNTQRTDFQLKVGEFEKGKLIVVSS